MSWLALTGVSVLCRAFMGVTHKVFTNKMTASAATQAVLFTVVAAVFVLAISPWVGGINLHIPPEAFKATLLVVLGQGVGNVAYFAAVQRLTAGTAQIAFSSILIFNTALSVLFLQLNLSLLNILGIMLLLSAILLVANGRIQVDFEGISLMVFAAFCYAIFQLASTEMAQVVSAGTYMFISYAGGAIIVFLVKAKTVWRDLSQLANWSQTLGIAALASLFSLGNFFFAYLAYRAAPEPAKVAILLTAQVVVAVVVSYVLLQERSHIKRKIVAAILVIGSAFLIRD